MIECFNLFVIIWRYKQIKLPPPKIKITVYAKQKDELICKPKNLGKLKKNTTCMKDNKGSLIFFHHLQVSMRSFSSSIRKTSQFLLCWNSYGWSNILFVLGRASKRSSLLLNLEELNSVDISPDWTCSSTRFVSLFLIRRWGRISQCCVVSEYGMK